MVSCQPVEYQNPCETTSKSFQKLYITQTITNSTQGFCGITSSKNSFGSNGADSGKNSFLISSPTLGYTLKNGGTDTFTVKLSAQPSASVTVPLFVSNPAQASVFPSSITFTTANWNSPQTVTVAGIDDLMYGVAGSFTVNLGPSSSPDLLAQNITGSTVSISNRDFRKLIFVSNLTTGNTGGISGADAFCNSDSNKPINTGIYKAFLTLPGVRVASVTANAGDGQIDWVLKPNQLYTRPNGLPIMITNSVSLFTAFPLINSVYTAGDAIWTGFQGTSDWISIGGCVGWTSTGAFGTYAVGNAVNSTSLLFGGNLSGANTGRLYCVQQ